LSEAAQTRSEPSSCKSSLASCTAVGRRTCPFRGLSRRQLRRERDVARSPVGRNGPRSLPSCHTSCAAKSPDRDLADAAILPSRQTIAGYLRQRSGAQVKQKMLTFAAPRPHSRVQERQTFTPAPTRFQVMAASDPCGRSSATRIARGTKHTAFRTAKHLRLDRYAGKAHVCAAVMTGLALSIRRKAGLNRDGKTTTS
jgi:hypothetical protein